MGMLSFLKKKEGQPSDLSADIPPPPPPQHSIYSDLPDLQQRSKTDQGLSELPTLDASGPNKMFVSHEKQIRDLPPVPKEMPPMRIIQKPAPHPFPEPSIKLGSAPQPKLMQPPPPIHPTPSLVHSSPIKVVSFSPRRQIPEPAVQRTVTHRPFRKISLPEGEHFVLATEFRAVREDLDWISKNISRVEEMLGRTNVPAILQKQDDEFRHYQRLLDEIQRKMVSTDGMLFEAE